MKSYLSLAAALLAGVVLGKERDLKFHASQFNYKKGIVRNNLGHPNEKGEDYVQRDLHSLKRHNSRKGLKERSTFGRKLRNSLSESSINDMESVHESNSLDSFNQDTQRVRSEMPKQKKILLGEGEDHHLHVKKQKVKSAHSHRYPQAQANLPQRIPKPTNIPDGATIANYFYDSGLQKWCAKDTQGRKMCYIEKEWQWKNKFENDGGTPDHSNWTSISTDGIVLTSPSVDQAIKSHYHVKTSHKKHRSQSQTHHWNELQTFERKATQSPSSHHHYYDDKLTSLSKNMLEKYEYECKAQNHNCNNYLEEILKIKEQAEINLRHKSKEKKTTRNKHKVQQYT